MNNSNILVVEDDFAIRSLITTALETENYKYHVAKNGKQAIIEATTQTPELILFRLIKIGPSMRQDMLDNHPRLFLCFFDAIW